MFFTIFFAMMLQFMAILADILFLAVSIVILAFALGEPKFLLPALLAVELARQAWRASGGFTAWSPQNIKEFFANAEKKKF